MNLFTSNQLTSFLKQTFFAGLFLSLTVYAWVRALLFEDPFSLREDGAVLLKTISTGWILMITIRLTWIGLLKVGELIQEKNVGSFSKLRLAITVFAVILLSGILYACNAHPGNVHH